MVSKEERMNWEIGIDIYIILYIRKITNNKFEGWVNKYISAFKDMKLRESLHVRRLMTFCFVHI